MISQASESWSATRWDDIAKQAKAFDTPFMRALAMRHGFLDAEIEKLNQEIQADYVEILTLTDELEFRFTLEGIKAKMQQIAKLDRMKPKKPVTGQITDADIAQAKSYPVDKLIMFTRGKATAFCHDDKSPSMYFGSRTNTAQCPVCARGFGGIDILMDRDGYSFTDAVKELCQR